MISCSGVMTDDTEWPETNTRRCVTLSRAVDRRDSRDVHADRPEQSRSEMCAEAGEVGACLPAREPVLLVILILDDSAACSVTMGDAWGWEWSGSVRCG